VSIFGSLRSIAHIIRANSRSGQAHSPFAQVKNSNEPLARLYEDARHGSFLGENLGRQENFKIHGHGSIHAKTAACFGTAASRAF
jgi:hypothetical protein